MTYKKIITILITCTLLIGSISIPTGAKYFTDIPSDYWALEPINYVTERGYIDTSGSTFDKFGNLTRAVAAEMMYRYAGSPSITVTSSNEPFSDVSTSATYRKAVAWLYSKGIMNGTSSTTFGPSETIHRQDIAVVLYRYARYFGKNITVTSAMIDAFESVGYVDEFDIADYAWFAVVWAYNKGIMTGKTATTLAPESDVDRQTGATVLMRYGMKIDGVKVFRDSFGFNNSKTFFGSNANYYISTAHLQILQNRLAAQDQSSYYNGIANSITGEWKGSCSGMSLVVVLNKLGKLNTAGNCSNFTVNQLINVDAPKNNLNVKSTINYYQKIYGVPTISSWATANAAYATNSAAFKNCLKKIPSAIEDCGCLYFAYKYDYIASDGTPQEGYHAIVLYNCIKNSDGSYTIEAYNPNDYNPATNSSTGQIDNTTVTINSSFTTLMVDQTQAKYINFPEPNGNSTYNVFDNYDLDSKYNNFDNNSRGTDSLTNTSVSSIVSDKDTALTYITLEPRDGVVIEDAEGRKLVFENGHYTGDLNVIKEYPIFEENNGVVLHQFVVGTSDKYTMYTTEESCTFGMMNNNIYTRVTGYDMNMVTINQSGEVSTDGNGEYTYCITTSNMLTDINMMSVAGKTSSNICVSVEKNNWDITGVGEKCEVSIFDLRSLTTENIKETETVTTNTNEHIVVTIQGIYKD